MATGLKITLDSTVSNDTLPVARIDKRLTAGSLLLVDFSHPLTNSITIPVTGGTIKNLAYIEAMSILATTEASVTPTVSNTIEAGKGLMEFTAKKGLHGIISQVSDITGGNDFKISIPTSIKNYIFSNITTRRFYVSVWTKYTRVATNINNNIDFNLFYANTSNYGLLLKPSGITPSVSGQFRFSTLNTTENRIVNSVLKSVVGSPSANNASEFIFGSLSGISSANSAPSTILYQLHIIDIETARAEYNTKNSTSLTLDEMYSVLDMADLGKWNQAFGVGGRFYNDTFTDPSTLP